MRLDTPPSVGYYTTVPKGEQPMTMTPNSPQELLNIQQGVEDNTPDSDDTPELTQKVLDIFSEMEYKEQDMLVFNLMGKMRDFYTGCLHHELKSETPDMGFIGKCVKDITIMNNILRLHEGV